MTQCCQVNENCEEYYSHYRTYYLFTYDDDSMENMAPNLLESYIKMTYFQVSKLGWMLRIDFQAYESHTCCINVSLPTKIMLH